MNYQCADLVIRLKNAALARRKTVTMPYSKMNEAIARVLMKEKFLESVDVEVDGVHKMLKLGLEYKERNPVIQGVHVISKPSLRVYSSAKKKSRQERARMGVAVLSTNQGVMTGKQAREKGIGGELLFEVW